MASLNRRVCREYAALADRIYIAKWVYRTAVLAEKLDRKEGRMALVHMKGLNVETQRSQHAHTANAEHNLLLQAIRLIAAVKPVGSSRSVQQRAVSPASTLRPPL